MDNPYAGRENLTLLLDPDLWFQPKQPGAELERAEGFAYLVPLLLVSNSYHIVTKQSFQVPRRKLASVRGLFLLSAPVMREGSALLLDWRVRTRFQTVVEEGELGEICMRCRNRIGDPYMKGGFRH